MIRCETEIHKGRDRRARQGKRNLLLASRASKKHLASKEACVADKLSKMAAISLEKWGIEKKRTACSENIQWNPVNPVTNEPQKSGCINRSRVAVL